jgi:hypothetical protein
MKYFAPLFALVGSAMADAVKDCSASDCILMMIGDNFSPLNTDQCKLHAPGLLDFGGDHFCGAFLDDTTGVVVSNVCATGGFCDSGAYEVYAAPVVDECTKMVDDINDSGEDVVAPPRGSGSGSGSGWNPPSSGRLDAKFSTVLYACITACPFLASAPIAQVDEASTASSFADHDNREAVTHKFSVQDTKYNGYTAKLPNNFGAMRGSVDTVAAKVPLALTLKIKPGTPKNDGSCGFMTLKMMPVAPSAMAAVLLFPGKAFATGGNVVALANGLMSNKFWFENSVSSGAELYFFNSIPASDSAKVTAMEALISAVGKEKAMDFPGLGDQFKAGDLGFLYGVLSQAQSSGDVTNVATLNFPVHGFQESFAYLFFSPLAGEFGKGSKPDLYALYGFALNMLVRRYASVGDAMCGAFISSTKSTGCAVKAALYTPVLVDAAATVQKGVPKPTDLDVMQQVLNQMEPKENGGFGIDGKDFVIHAPPAANLGLIDGYTATLVLEDRDIEKGTDPQAALGEWTEATDPSIDVQVQCDMMMSELHKAAEMAARGQGSGSGDGRASREIEEKMMHVNHQCLGMMSEEAGKLSAIKGTVKGQVEYYALFSHVACMQLGMSSTKCTAEFQKQMAEAAMKYGKMDIQMWEGWVNNYVMSMMQGGQNMPPPGGGKPPMGRGRRLSDTDDFSLSALRSASASSALAREDGVLSRANFDARRLGGSGSGSGSGKSCSGPKGCVSNYIHYLGIYTKCIEQMKIKNSCSNVLAGLTSSDAKVNAFYSKTELVAAASCGKAVPVEPSECPVSFYDKEVYFMWGEGGFHATSERAKTSDVYVGKGLPAASRLDRLMNFFTELFVAA